MRPLAKAATMLPPTAFRFDPGAAITVLARYLPQIVTGGTDGLKLLGSFKKVCIACNCSMLSHICRSDPRQAGRQIHHMAPTSPFMQ
jgi:hypothetical protein